jgi:hypothetical protein
VLRETQNKVFDRFKKFLSAITGTEAQNMTCPAPAEFLPAHCL